jgi:hypothetical protein
MALVLVAYHKPLAKAQEEQESLCATMMALAKAQEEQGAVAWAT